MSVLLSVKVLNNWPVQFLTVGSLHFKWGVKKKTPNQKASLRLPFLWLLNTQFYLYIYFFSPSKAGLVLPDRAATSTSSFVYFIFLKRHICGVINFEGNSLKQLQSKVIYRLFLNLKTKTNKQKTKQKGQRRQNRRIWNKTFDRHPWSCSLYITMANNTPFLLKRSLREWKRGVTMPLDERSVVFIGNELCTNQKNFSHLSYLFTVQYLDHMIHKPT